MAAKNANAVEPIVMLLDDAFNKPAWHGPNLRGAIRRVTARQATWRPKPGRRNIAEIAVHCSYWKYAARRRLLNEKRGSFPLKGSNWFALPAKLSEAQWKGYVRLLDETHAALREAAADLRASRLREVTKGGKVTNAKLLYGMAMHDVYHAGQIRTLKALMGAKG